ncbi:MAG: hypothetical protein ACHREM_19575 [Polyangiales bacterium]
MTTTHAAPIAPVRTLSRTLAGTFLVAAGVLALEACAHPIVVTPLKALPSDEGTESVREAYRAVGKQIGKTYKLDLGFLVSLDHTWESVKVWNTERGQWVDPPVEQPRRRSVTVAFGGRLKSDSDKCGWAIGTVTQTNQGGSSWGDAVFAGGGYLKRREVPGFVRENGNPDGRELLAVGDVLPLDCSTLDSVDPPDTSEPSKKEHAYDARQALASLPPKTPEVCRSYAKAACTKDGLGPAEQKRACERVIADVKKIAAEPTAAKSCAKLQKSASTSKASTG